jgi:hypothetical protein
MVELRTELGTKMWRLMDSLTPSNQLLLVTFLYDYQPSDIPENADSEWLTQQAIDWIESKL